MARAAMGRRKFLMQAAGTAAGVGTATPAADGAVSGTPGAPATGEAVPASPTANLDDVQQAVRGVVASRRIGRPVFVRYTVQGADAAASIVGKLARMVEAARAWIEQPLARLHAVGSTAAGQVCLTLQFRGGATGLVSYARGRPLGDGVDLMVVGNHGAIYHDAGNGSLWDATADYPEKKMNARLEAVIEQALRSGKPVTLDSDKQP